jgi:TetR/AcrR family transcriptional repressor of mexJK operon
VKHKEPAQERRTSQGGGRTARKREDIKEAGTTIFLRDGFLGANMDEIAQLADVSKQTIYAQFQSKEALFLDIVSALTNAGSDAVHGNFPELTSDGDLQTYLERYAYKQLEIVLTPRLMQLRRVVIGEVGRFPELGKALYESGPKRAMATMASMFKRLAARKLLVIEDPVVAASHFNWLVMSQPLNQAMLLGNSGIPGPVALRRHAKNGVRVFLAAYGAK